MAKGKTTQAKKKAKAKARQKSKPSLKNLHDDDLHGTSEELDDDERDEIRHDRKESKLHQHHTQYKHKPPASSYHSLESFLKENDFSIEAVESKLRQVVESANFQQAAGGQYLPPAPNTNTINTNRDDLPFSTTSKNDMLDIEDLYSKYVVGNEEWLESQETSKMDEMSMLKASHMSDFDNIVTRYVVGQAMSQLQYEEGFKSMKEYLDPGEFRQLLAHFYYDYHRIKLPNNERIDLNKLFQECTVEALPDVIAKKFEAEEPEAPPRKEPKKSEDSKDNNKDQGDMEIGLYGWGHYLQPELKRRQVMKEMLFWYKLKLASSRVEGFSAAKQWMDARSSQKV